MPRLTDRRLRIALVSREYPPETGFGGIGTYVHHLAHALAAEGHKVNVISRAPELPETDYDDGEVRVHRVQENKYKGPLDWKLYRLMPLTEYRYAKRVFRKVWALHEQHRFDVIEVPEYRAEGYFITRKPPAPVVLKLHTPTAIANEINSVVEDGREKWVNRMEKKGARRASLITSPSASLADWTARIWRLKREAIQVVPNPIDTSVWSPQPYPESDPVILYVGRLEIRKGIETLGQAWIKTAAKHARVRLRIVGNVDEAPLRRKWADIFSRHHVADRVEWIPWQQGEALRACYAQASIVTVPSVYENFPNTCLEGMATGRPVVAGRAGGLIEMIEHGVSGLLFPPKDPEALAGSFLTLLASPDRCREMGLNAAHRVAVQYGTNAVVKQTIDVYDSVVRG